MFQGRYRWNQKWERGTGFEYISWYSCMKFSTNTLKYIPKSIKIKMKLPFLNKKTSPYDAEAC